MNKKLKRTLIMGSLIAVSLLCLFGSKSTMGALIGLSIIWLVGFVCYYLWKPVSRFIEKASEDNISFFPKSSSLPPQIREEPSHMGGSITKSKQLTVEEELYLTTLQEEMYDKEFDPPIKLGFKRKPKQGYRKPRKPWAENPYDIK